MYRATDAPERTWGLRRPTSGPRLAEDRARHGQTYVPPNTVIVVASLAAPEYLLEIEAVSL